MLHDIDVQNGLVYALVVERRPRHPRRRQRHQGRLAVEPDSSSTQYKYDLDALYKDVEAEGGKGFIRGTHTAWRYKDYVIIADEVFGNTAAEALYSGGISRAHGRLQVLDVKDIEHPKSVAWYEPDFGGVHNVWVAGDTLYLGAYNAGFKAFDLSGELRGDLKAQGRMIGEMMPSDPKGHVPNVPMTWGVVVNRKDGLAYVNDFNSGLWAVRIEPKKAVRRELGRGSCERSVNAVNGRSNWQCEPASGSSMRSRGRSSLLTVSSPTHLTRSPNRFPTSSQFTVFHHAFR